MTADLFLPAPPPIAAAPRATMLGCDGVTHDITPAPPRNAHWIGRCRFCRKVKPRPIRVAIPMVNKKTVANRHVAGTHYSFVTSEWVAAPGHSQYPPDLYCIRCHYRISFQLVNGRFSENHKCDARCINAIGPNCECQCGGANHGAGYDPIKLTSLR